MVLPADNGFLLGHVVRTNSQHSCGHHWHTHWESSQKYDKAGDNGVAYPLTPAHQHPKDGDHSQKRNDCNEDSHSVQDLQDIAFLSCLE